MNQNSLSSVNSKILFFVIGVFIRKFTSHKLESTKNSFVLNLPVITTCSFQAELNAISTCTQMSGLFGSRMSRSFPQSPFYHVCIVPRRISRE